jgi:hypothetical protein
MLEESVCAGLVDAAAPLLSVSALRSLMHLLDSQDLAVSCSGHENQKSPEIAGDLVSSKADNVASGVKRKCSDAGAPAMSASPDPTTRRDHSGDSKGAKP